MKQDRHQNTAVCVDLEAQVVSIVQDRRAAPRGPIDTMLKKKEPLERTRPIAESLELAASTAEASQCLAVIPMAQAVRKHADRAGIMENEQLKASEQMAYYECHLNSSIVLHEGKKHYEAQEYDEALRCFEQGLKFPTDSATWSQRRRSQNREESGGGGVCHEDQPMRYRWDLEMWKKLCVMHKSLSPGANMWEAVKEVETPRTEPGVLWSHDAAGSEGLVKAMEGAFQRMGAGDGSEGLLPEKRSQLIKEIEENEKETKAQVTMISDVLKDLHTELGRLAAGSPLSQHRTGEREPEPEDDGSQLLLAGVAAEQVGVNVQALQDHWKAYSDDQETVALGKLQEMLKEGPTEAEASHEQIFAAKVVSTRSSQGNNFDFNDFMFLVQLQIAHTPVKELEEVFEIFDTDGKGFITASKLRETMASLGYDLGDAELDEMMREGDTDREGEIDTDKFQAMMRRGGAGSHSLEQTLKLVVERCGPTGQDKPQHRPLPALISATKAVAAASRFCDYAFAAAATDFTLPTSAESLKLQTKCVGTQFWALAVAKLILSERSIARPAVSFALPGTVPRNDDQCDVDDAIMSLRLKLDEWMKASQQELKRRNHVRVSVECGETARSRRRALEALAFFEQAKEHAKTGIEITQLEKLIARSKEEKQRQTTVQELHKEADVALGQTDDQRVPDGARVAIARYSEAVRPPLEHDERSPEHKSLQVMHNLVNQWAEADDELTAWKGKAALEKYQTAMQHAEEVKTIRPTEGYVGEQIRLHTAAVQELEACIARANTEIRRKNKFKEQIKGAETHLIEWRAGQAQGMFTDALETSTHAEEVAVCEDGTARADAELARQKEAKEAYEEAFEQLARCTPPKGLEWGSAEWDEQAAGAEIAIDKCSASLATMESTDGRLKAQKGTKEHQALTHVRKACEKWKEADALMSSVYGVGHSAGQNALDAFIAAQKSMDDAIQARVTPGYYCSAKEDGLRNRTKTALVQCIASATEEVGRADDTGATAEAARAAGAASAAEKAVKIWEQVVAEERNPKEKKIAEDMLRQQQEELARQMSVYDLHVRGLQGLKANDPTAALVHYTKALTIEKPAEAGAELAQTSSRRVKVERTEPESLQHMKDICEAWIKANASLFAYDGKEAQRLFRACHTSAAENDLIKKTAGYAGAKIQLRAQGTDLALKECMARADKELERNTEFDSLIDKGTSALRVWKAEEALQAYFKAGQLAAEDLKYMSGEMQIERPKSPKELKTQQDCMANGEKEITRQQKVKEAVRKCVQALESNDADLAFARTRSGKTTTARQHCQDALDHATKSEGLESQKGTTTEVQAIELLAELCELWKRGDDRLEQWDGIGAHQAYEQADVRADSITALQPTAGYTSKKILLRPDAVKKMLQKADEEIARKIQFDGHIDNCRTHLNGWRAEHALKEATHALETQTTASATTDSEHDDGSRAGLMGEFESATHHVHEATAELQRQKALKECFKDTRDGLDELHYKKACTRWTGKSTPIDHCNAALKLAEQTDRKMKVTRKVTRKESEVEGVNDEEGDEVEVEVEVQLQSQVGTPEHQAILSMLALCKQWKRGDEALRRWDGSAALENFKLCKQTAEACKALSFTKGYFGPKIEPIMSTDTALANSLNRSNIEIKRRSDFDAINQNSGKQQAILDRAATHLRIPERSGCRKCAYDAQSRSQSHVTYAGKCLSCGSPLAPSPATVHTIGACVLYLQAFETVMCAEDRNESVQLMDGALDSLSAQLSLERAAYTESADTATQNFRQMVAVSEAKGMERRVGSSKQATDLSKALETLAKWSDTSFKTWRSADGGQPIVTAEHINGELEQAWEILQDMYASNDRIRKADKQKIKRKPDANSGAVTVILEEEEEEESSDEEYQSPRLSGLQSAGLPTEISEIAEMRNRQRKSAVENGDTYAATCKQLEPQQQSADDMWKDVDAGIRFMDLEWNRLTSFRQLCHAWQVAGAPDPTPTKAVAQMARQQMERVVAIGFWRTKTTVLVDVSMTLKGEELLLETTVVGSSAMETVSYQLRGAAFPRVPSADERRRTQALRPDGSKFVTRPDDLVSNHVFKIVLSNGGDECTIAAKNAQEMEQWILVLQRKVRLLDEGDPDPEPEPEPESEVMVTRQDCLKQAQTNARAAVQIAEWWKQSMDHESLTNQTDEGLGSVRALLQQVSQMKQLADTLSQWQQQWQGNIMEKSLGLLRQIEHVQKQVRAERAMREISPQVSLRAAMWGLGEKYPQLSAHEVQEVHSRYAEADPQAQGVGIGQDITDQGLREAVTGLLGEDTKGFYEHALAAGDLLREELDSLIESAARARDRDVHAKIEGCRPHVDAAPPSTSELDRLQELAGEQADAQLVAVQAKELLNRREDRYDEGHEKYPTKMEKQDVEDAMTETRRALRKTTKLVDTEMSKLAVAGSDHWPEVLNSAPSIKDFKRMDFLRTKNLSFDSYENVQPLTGRGRNDVSLATLDGREVVLKAYDLGAGGATSVAAVTKEVRGLHRMRHPNIVRVEAVFEKLAQGEAKMYLQMPRYNGDLRDWLEKHHERVPPEQRRKILLGILRAVARVHEFNFTHNDIKLENILLTGQDEAVLCDFELLKEESMAGSTIGATTLVGGTPAYMPPERLGPSGIKGKPHWTADMFAVGVVMLLCFAPDRIVEVTRKDGRTPATTVRDEMKEQLDERINGIIADLLSNTKGNRPSARKLLPEGQIGGAESDNYFSRASNEVPTYWLPGDAMLNSVTDDAHIMAALRRAIAPNRPDEFGKGIDTGQEWNDVVRLFCELALVLDQTHIDIDFVFCLCAHKEHLQHQPGLGRHGQSIDQDRKGLAGAKSAGLENVRNSPRARG